MASSSTRASSVARARARAPVDSEAAAPARGDKRIVSLTQWQQAYTAWAERPNVDYVAAITGLPKVTVKRLIDHGAPEIAAPAMRRIPLDPIRVQQAMTTRRAQELSVPVQDETIGRAADEASAARAVLRASLRIAQSLAITAEKTLKLVESGKITLEGELTIDHLLRLTRAVEGANNAVHRAMQIDRLRTGQPETVLGLQVGLMLDGLSDEELVRVRADEKLPARLLGMSARAVVDATATPTVAPAAPPAAPEAPLEAAPEAEDPVAVALAADEAALVEAEADAVAAAAVTGAFGADPAP